MSASFRSSVARLFLAQPGNKLEAWRQLPAARGKGRSAATSGSCGGLLPAKRPKTSPRAVSAVRLDGILCFVSLALPR